MKVHYLVFDRDGGYSIPSTISRKLRAGLKELARWRKLYPKIKFELRKITIIEEVVA